MGATPTSHHRADVFPGPGHRQSYRLTTHDIVIVCRIWSYITEDNVRQCKQQSNRICIIISRPDRRADVFPDIAGLTVLPLMTMSFCLLQPELSVRKSWVLKEIAGRRLPHCFLCGLFWKRDLLKISLILKTATKFEENSPEKKICRRVKGDIATNGLYRGMDLAGGAS